MMITLLILSLVGLGNVFVSCQWWRWLLFLLDKPQMNIDIDSDTKGFSLVGSQSLVAAIPNKSLFVFLLLPLLQSLAFVAIT